MKNKTSFIQVRIKVIAFFLAVITFISMFAWIPLQASATDQKTTESYVEFQARCYSDLFDDLFVNNKSLPSSFANTLFTQLDGDVWLKLQRATWEAGHMLVEPSYATGKITDVERYKLVIFDMMIGTSDSKNAATVYSDLMEAMSNDRRTYVSSLTAGYLKEVSNKSLKKQAVTTANVKKLNVAAEASGMSKIASDSLQYISNFATVFNNMQELVEAYSSYQAVANMKDGTEKILWAIYDDSSNPHGLRNAAYECISYFTSAYTDILQRIINGSEVYTATTFKTCMKLIVDNAWDQFATAAGFGLMFKGIQGIRILANSIFDLDEANRLYYALGACVDVENALRKVMSNTRYIYKSSPNIENASNYIQSVELYKKVVLLGFDYCNEMLKHEGGKKGQAEASARLQSEIESYKELRQNSYLKFEKAVYKAYINATTPKVDKIENDLNNNANKNQSTKTATKDAQKVVDLAIDKVGTSYANGYCLRFVREMFQQAYGFNSSACCAYKYGDNFIDSKNMDDIPLGASVFFAGSSKTCSSCKNKCGHIGIYVGNGYIVHAWSGKIVKTTIDNVVKKGYPYRGWGWHGNKQLICSSYNISSVSCIETTNNSATIDSKLNDVATVQKWTYFLSKDKSKVEKVDGTDGNTHKTISGMDCVRILDYTSDPQKQSGASFTINKFAKQPLAPNTTYYYKVTLKIGNNWYESGVYSFTTDNALPESPEVRVADASKKVGIGDQVTLLWNMVSGADKYRVLVKDTNGNIVQEKNDITGLTCVLDGISASGEYTVEIYATNSAGSTQGKSASFTVMPDVTVTFFDTVDNKAIDVRTIHWGHGTEAPLSPQHEGHTFTGWSASFDKVTKDIKVDTVYDVHTYTVKFVDNITGTIIGNAQTVEYGKPATAPDMTNYEVPDGHAFTSWDKDFSSIKSNTTIYTVYEWIDKDNTATISINSIKRSSTGKGYEVSVTVNNKIKEISTGYAIFVLKSKGGAILSTFESYAFTIDALGSQTFTTTVLCDSLAEKAEVYVVNGYDALGQIAKVAKADIDNSTSSEWSEWIEYTGSCPMTSGNGVTVETKSVPYTNAYYRYQTYSTKTSTNPSLTGWTQNGYTLVNAVTTTNEYVANWPKGFDTDNDLYKKYNNNKIEAREDSKTKVVVKEEVIGYIYWHWCDGKDYNLQYNRSIGWEYHEGGQKRYDTFHAFYSTAKKTYSASPVNAYKFANAACCEDSYWWNGAVSGKDGLVTIKRQTITTYDKLYNYYQYSSYSAWKQYTGNSVPVANGQSAGDNKTYVNVQTKTETGNKYYYRYMTTTNPTITEPTVSVDCIKTLEGNVGNQFAGKTVTVWVYKSDAASNKHVQYVGTSTVGSDGSVKVEKAKLLSAPTISTGDYTIVASVAGQDKTIEIGTIEAPKPSYTVKFFDVDGKTVISEQTIVEGDSAILPDESLLSVPEGYMFTTWNQSVVNVRSDLNVIPQFRTEKYVVAFVDWNAQTVELKEFYHGSELYISSAPKAKDGYITEWVVKVGDEYLTIDEFHGAGYKISSNMVVETRSTLEKHYVIIVDADKDKLLDADKLNENGITDEDIASEFIVENGNYIDFGDVQMSIEENPNYIFYGWINANTGEAINKTTVDQNMVIYPSYAFAVAADVPTADVTTGEYDEHQIVTLTSQTEGATIWYTTDNTNPLVSETAVEYNGPITISQSCILRYYASTLGMNDSCEEYQIYAINTEENNKYHVVTIWSNIYDENGSVPAYVLIKSGEQLTATIFDNVVGHRFEGLFYNVDYNDEFACDFDTITSSINLYAKYSLSSYNVVFKNYDGAVLHTEVVDYLGCANTPIPPHREGYIFVNWDREYNCITDDIEVFAVYIPESENVTVSLDEKSPVNIEIGEAVNLHANVTTENHVNYEMIWVSSNDDVASVDQNGKVVAKSSGSVTIKVRIPSTGSESAIIVNVLSQDYFAIVLKSASIMGFDEENNLRGVPLGENTVAKIRTHFENNNLVFCDDKGKMLDEDDLVVTGTLIQLYDGAKLIAQTTAVVTGDFNCDGKVNNKDLVMINQYIENIRVANEIQLIAIDVNGDGIVTDRDCTILSNYLVDKEILD